MSVLHINNITNKEGTGGPTIAGITTVDSTGFMRVPVGSTGRRTVSDFVPNSIIDDGLVLYLDAGNIQSYPGSGTTWTDLSGNNNNGTLVNGVGFSAEDGGSLEFDGVNDYVDVIETTNTFSGSFSVSLWYYAKIDTGGYRIFFETNGYRVSSGAGLAMYQYDNFWSIWGRPTTNGSNTNMINTSAGSLGLNVWKNITLTRDINTGSLVLYLNGVSSGSYSGNTADYYELNTTRKYNIGGGRTEYFSNSNISQVSIYNRALTAQEVQQNFNATRSRYGI